MLLVVYGHCVQDWNEFFVFTSPVKMPLFFAISGYLFKSRDGNQKQFFKSIFLKLIIPWIIFGLFPFIIMHPIQIVERIYSLISGKILWFMPCLIIAEIIWFYVGKFIKDPKWVVVTGVAASLLGFFLNANHLLRFAMIDTAFVVQAFFVLGFLLKKYEERFSVRSLILLFVVLYIGLGIFTLYYYPGMSLDVHLNKYYNFGVCALMIVLGCLMLFFSFRQFNVKWKWLVYIGQNTLIIYMLHGYGLLLSSKFLSVFWGQYITYSPVIALIKTFIAVACCCVIAFAVNKYVPQIVGKKK